MPTRGKLPHSFPSIFPIADLNWTDDLPVCKFTGIGSSTNQLYRKDGQRQEEHPFEDKCIHICPNETTSLYGVFDGHEGIHAANFCLQRLCAELLLGQLNKKSSDEEIKDVLRQAFLEVEKSYLESLDGKVAKRTSLQDEIPHNLTPYEAYQHNPHLAGELDKLNSELSCGTTAVVALVTEGKLFVSNVGDSRALLCKVDSNDVLRVVQLSVDHDLSNEDEIFRIESLGLRVKHLSKLGNQENTRCLGNYLVKGGYKEFETLADASEEPIIAEPEIHGGIHLDQSCRFLLLMSDGLYRSLEEATGTDQVNKDIAQMAFAEFQVQSTLMGVAQAVVDKVVRLHHDSFVSGKITKAQGKRDDITLLVRNFYQPMPSATHSTGNDKISSMVSSIDDSSTTYTNTGSESNPGTQPILAYVDFTEFYRNVERARASGALPPILM